METFTLSKGAEGYYIRPFRIEQDRRSPSFQLEVLDETVKERWVLQVDPRKPLSKEFEFRDAKGRLLTAHTDEEGFIQHFTIGEILKITDEDVEIKANEGNHLWFHVVRKLKIKLD